MVAKYIFGAHYFMYMDNNDLDALQEQRASLENAIIRPHIIEGIKHYAATGTPFHAEIGGGEEFNELVSLLSITNINAQNVLRYHIENTESGDLFDSQSRAHRALFDGEEPVHKVFARIADIQSLLIEQPNDYRATFLMKFDETTVIALGQHSSSLSNAHIYEYNYRYWVGLFDASDVDSHPSWREWRL